MITTHHSGSIYGTKIGPKSTNARSALCCLPAFSIRRPKAVVTRKARYSPSKHLVQLLESSSSTSARLISPTKRLRPSDCCTRRAVLLARHTGQRQADVLRMAPEHIDDGGIVVVQQKTGKELWVPLHPDLGTALEGWDSSPYVINRKRRVVHSSALQERLGRLHERHACRQDQRRGLRLP